MTLENIVERRSAMSTMAELETLVSQGKSLTVEFKKSTAEKERAGLPAPILAVEGGFVVLTLNLPIKKTSEKTSEKILSALRNNPQLTIAELADSLGVTTRTVERNLKKLQDENNLSRVGHDKGGYWKVHE